MFGILAVHTTEDGARKALTAHLRSLGDGQWGSALRHVTEDEAAYVRAYRLAELYYAASDVIRTGGSAVEFRDDRYELFNFNPVETGA